MAKQKKVQQFLMLEYALIRGPLWNGLSRPSRDVYEQIRSSRYARNKNGAVVNTNHKHIEFSYLDLTINMAKSTYYESIKELRARGLIEIIDQGNFPSQKGERGKKTVFALSKKWRTYNHNMLNGTTYSVEKGEDDESDGERE